MTAGPPCLSLPVAHWPQLDRERWRVALQAGGLFEPDKPASRWSPARRKIVVQAYGQWLAFLDRGGMLDPACGAADRATEARLRAFVTELQGRVAPASVSLMVGGLLRIFAALAPEGDWTMLGRVYSHLKQTAAPSRDKISRLVAAGDLFELGIRLMQTCEDGPRHRTHIATQYRDGLIIALLICCPIRLKNLTELVIGQHLVFDGEAYGLQLTAAETKTGRPYRAAIPTELTGYIGRYLEVIRPELQSIAPGGAGGRLWLGRFGTPLGSAAIRVQIEQRTKTAFGRAVWPHLFRDCAVTELVDLAPEEIGVAADLLGHTGLQTTQKHYIHAQGMTAHARVQEVIQRRRAAASS